MKLERSVADVTSVGSPDIAERDILKMILDVFWQLQAALVVGGLFCDIGTLSWAVIALLNSFVVYCSGNKQ